MDGANNGEDALEVATLGGGCFWCLEAIYDRLEGVESVVSGYAGGTVKNPTYKQVCTGTTGHAEVVQVTFDTQQISFKEILEIFFTMHDPTTLNRQGNDVGPQYRSAIFFHDDRQRNIALETMEEIDEAGIWDAPIVTELAPLDTFYPAEEYHQEYFERNQLQPYCRIVIAPKVAKFKAKYAEKLKTA